MPITTIRRAASAKSATTAVAALALAAGLALTPTAQAAEVFALGSGGTTLVRFDHGNPGGASVVGPLSGASARILGLDFRPANGLLYGFAADSGIYTINTSTGAATLVSTSPVALTSPSVGVDFNPVPDRLRVVTDSTQNLRINVANGVTITDTPLTYAAADVNAGFSPQVVDAAYTNSDKLAATGTTLYYIDWARDTLVTTSNPNGGVLNTVGGLGVDTSNLLGFDILTDAAGNNMAFATLNVGGTQGFYTVNLATGAATFVGNTNVGDLFGLAVAPVPEPGTLALVAAAGLALLAQRRRKA